MGIPKTSQRWRMCFSLSDCSGVSARASAKGWEARATTGFAAIGSCLWVTDQRHCCEPPVGEIDTFFGIMRPTTNTEDDERVSGRCADSTYGTIESEGIRNVKVLMSMGEAWRTASNKRTWWVQPPYKEQCTNLVVESDGALSSNQFWRWSNQNASVSPYGQKLRSWMLSCQRWRNSTWYNKYYSPGQARNRKYCHISRQSGRRKNWNDLQIANKGERQGQLIEHWQEQECEARLGNCLWLGNTEQRDFLVGPWEQPVASERKIAAAAQNATPATLGQGTPSTA